MATIDNLPQEISVHYYLAYTKCNEVLVIIMNQKNHNVWIWQPLVAAEIVWVEHLPWDYWVEFHHEGQKIEVAFKPISMADIMASVQTVHDKPDKVPSKKKPVKSLTTHLDPNPIPKWLVLI